MAEPEEQEEKEQDIDLWLQMQTWAETRRKQLGVGVVVIIVVIFAVYTNNHLQAKNHADADAALMALNLPTSEPKEVPATAYLKVAQEFSGTPAAERALLLAATALFTENKYSDAEARFGEFVTQFPNSRQVDTARLGVAASQDAQNKTEQAISSYELVISAGTRAEGISSTEADQAKLAVALLYEQSGRPEKALSLYDEIIRSQQMFWRGEASIRREALLDRHPNLTASAQSSTLGTAATATTNQTDKASLGPFPFLVPTNQPTTNALTK